MIKKRIFRTKTFSRWLSKSDLSDADLVQAVAEMDKGLLEGDLGGHVYKKRVAIGNRGKSRGARTIVATKLSDHWFFIFAFAKNERTNISDLELTNFQKIAEVLLNLANDEISKLIQEKTLIEVKI
jgi:hypothetical protein